MTREELISKIQDIEWDDFEAKEALNELPKNMWDTVSAFSNTSGGWVLCGVAQKGKKFEILGVKRRMEKRLRMISLPHFETKISSITLSSAVRTRLLLMVNWFWRSIFLRQK